MIIYNILTFLSGDDGVGTGCLALFSFLFSFPLRLRIADWRKQII